MRTWLTTKAALEPVTSAAALAAALAAFATVTVIANPPKRVGVDWEHHKFMLRDKQGTIVPDPPHGPAWYVEPQSRRI